MISDATVVKLINQIHDIGKRATGAQMESIGRSCERIKNMLQEDGVIIHNPIGEAYNSSRTDCVANIMAGGGNKPMIITEVIKPVIYWDNENKRELIQQGVVIVE